MKTKIKSIKTGTYYNISIKSSNFIKVKHLLEQLNFNPKYTSVFLNDEKADLNTKIYQFDKIFLIPFLEERPRSESLIKDEFPDLLLLDQLRLTKIDPDTLLKERQCFKCGKNLYFRHYLSGNKSTPIESLIKTWQSVQVEIYCCNCYEKVDIERMLEEISILKPINVCSTCNKIINFHDFISVKGVSNIKE